MYCLCSDIYSTELLKSKLPVAYDVHVMHYVILAVHYENHCMHVVHKYRNTNPSQSKLYATVSRSQR